MKVKKSLDYIRSSKSNAIYDVTGEILWDQFPEEIKSVSKVENGRFYVPKKFKKNVDWYHLHPHIKNRMIANQIEAVGYGDPEIFQVQLRADTSGGGFTWTHSLEGLEFWQMAMSDTEYPITEDNWRVLIDSPEYCLCVNDYGDGEYKIIRK